MRGVGDAGQGGGAGLLALAVAGLSASGSWARRAGGEGSGEVWAAGESGPGRRQGKLGRASWAAGGWGLGRVSSWVGFLVLGSLPFYFYFLHY